MPWIIVSIAVFTVSFTGSLHAGCKLDYMESGFGELSQYSGLRQTVAIIEPGISYDFYHPSIEETKQNIRFIDVGRHKCPYNAEDASEYRYPSDFPINCTFWTQSSHMQQVASLLIGKSNQRENYPGGLLPDSRIVLIGCSHADSHIKKKRWPVHPCHFAGTAIYRFSDPDFFDQTQEKISQIPKDYLEKGTKIDDSIYAAVGIAFGSGARVIEQSFFLQAPSDFTNFFKLTDSYIEYLALGLERNDQILVVAAGNDRHDIHFGIQEGIRLFNINRYDEDTDELIEPNNIWGYHYQYGDITQKIASYLGKHQLLQYAIHPVLKQRVIMVVNAERINSDQPNVTFSNNQQMCISLSDSSNFPGDNQDLQDITVAAFGEDLSVAAIHSGFITASGTSLSVPIVTALLTKMDQFYKEKGIALTGPELVRILKQTCLLPSNKREYFGCGIINPTGFLKMQKL